MILSLPTMICVVVMMLGPGAARHVYQNVSTQDIYNRTVTGSANCDKRHLLVVLSFRPTVLVVNEWAKENGDKAGTVASIFPESWHDSIRT